MLVTRPPEYLKPLANRLAEAAASSDGARLMQLLQQAGLLGAQEEVQPPQKPGRIGIWEPKSKAGRVSYVRSLDSIADWPRWANLARIDPKHTRWRILFLGESVARGYLYEPFYTPAMVLQSLLEGVLGKGSVEVVDLARTDMGTEIKDLATSAAALEPDGLVIFAGNNWRPVDLITEGRRSEVDAILRAGGVAELKRFAEDCVRLRAQAVVLGVRDFYGARKIPVIWTIPEFNLGDWKDWPTNAPHLRGSANRQWLACCEEAEDALARGDFAAAEHLAQQMLDLDEQTNSHTLAILARCRLHAGDVSGARTYLELASDARLWDWSQPLSPRCLAASRQEIKAHCQCGTSAVVDLRELYREYLGGALPDRRLFLDYCHLTVEGIRLSMAAVAARLAMPLLGRMIDWRALFAEAPAPSAAVEAEGALLAAVHNAHWFQPQPVVEYFCSRALKVSPHTADVMARFIELQTTATPSLLSRPAERLSQVGGQAVQYLLGPYNIQQLDAVLLTSMACALEKTGQPAHAALRQHWVAGHDASESATDLLDYYYLSSAGQPQELFWARRDIWRTSPAPPSERSSREFAMADYYRAYGIESTFVFVAGGHRDVQFDLTCRIPDADGPAGTIRVFVNETPIADLPGERAWRRHIMQARSGALRKGLNQLRIRWPLCHADQRAKLIAAADSLVHHPVQPLFQVFGEIHSLTASPAEEYQSASALRNEHSNVTI
jgi:hypothetical protein